MCMHIVRRFVVDPYASSARAPFSPSLPQLSMFSWQRRMRKYGVFCLILPSLCSASIWSFPPKRFKGNALLEAGSLGLGDDERAVAFGDFDGDQLYVISSVSRVDAI